MSDCAEGGRQLPVKGGVSGAHPRQLLGVERQRLPAPSSQLLKHTPYVCVGGIRCEGEHSVRGAMRQQYRSRQGGHGRLEGGGGGRPLQRLGVPSECIGEGLERAGNTWNVCKNSPYLKTVVIVSHPEGEEIH